MKIGSSWDSWNFGKVVNHIKGDRRALKALDHIYSSLKSFERHGERIYLPSFCFTSSGNTSTPCYTIPWVVWLAEARWDDMELISRNSLSLKVSPAIYFPNVKEDTNHYDPCCQRFQGSQSNTSGRVCSIWACHEAKWTVENTTEQPHHSTDFLTIVAGLQVKCHLLSCAFI